MRFHLFANWDIFVLIYEYSSWRNFNVCITHISEKRLWTSCLELATCLGYEVWGSEYSIRNPTGCNEQLRAFKITPLYESKVLLLEPPCSLQFVYVNFGFLHASCFPPFLCFCLTGMPCAYVPGFLTPSVHNIRSDLIHTWGGGGWMLQKQK